MSKVTLVTSFYSHREVGEIFKGIKLPVVTIVSYFEWLSDVILIYGNKV